MLIPVSDSQHEFGVMQDIAVALQNVATHDEMDSLPLLKKLVDALRPKRKRCEQDAPVRWAFMLQQLRDNNELRNAVRRAVLQLFVSRRQVTFYTDSGLLPATGFFSELNRILMHKWLPEVRDPEELRTSVAYLFSHRDDEAWINAIPVDQRRAFWLLLDMQGSEDGDALRTLVESMLNASLVLSHRIAAMGLLPELARAYPRLRDVESPFMAMNVELIDFVEDFRGALDTRSIAADIVSDADHFFVLLDQCEETVRRAHASASRLGTSLSLSFLLTRLSQHLHRLKLLVQVLTVRFRPEAPEALTQCWTDMLFAAMDGERQHNSVRRHFSNLVSMLALRITDNAARTGEHYIANTRSEWFQMLRDAAGAGVLIATLALLKILGVSLHLAPTAQYWLNAGIYASGFALIYMLHFVIATKQPAMTAATLASSISQTSGRLRDTEKIVDLIVDTFRSQLAAIVGNIFVAFPLAMLLLLAVQTNTANEVVSAEKAHHMLQELRPFGSLALFHAAIAGVWLFFTGLVSGYLDNRAAYTQLGPRIGQLRWLRRLLGKPRAVRLGNYIADHAGGLGGNIFFGLALGLTPGIGSWLGLPLDIRHIAFSSANLGYSLVALDFSVPPDLLLAAIAGVLLVGAVNLLVSFALAMGVALRSRHASFGLLMPVLPRLSQRLLQKPGSFFRPPSS
jgi:site-specific recombinase